MLKPFKSAIVFILLYSSQAHCLFLGLESNMANISNQEMRNYQTAFEGTGNKLTVGINGQLMALAIFLGRGKYQAPILNDDEKFNALWTETTYGFMSHVLFSEIFYFNLGYGFYKIDHGLESGTLYDKKAIFKNYGLKEDFVQTEGLIIGVGAMLYKGDTFSLYTEFNQKDYSALSAKDLSISVGLRMSVNLNLLMKIK